MWFSQFLVLFLYDLMRFDLALNHIWQQRRVFADADGMLTSRSVSAKMGCWCTNTHWNWDRPVEVEGSVLCAYSTHNSSLARLEGSREARQRSPVCNSWLILSICPFVSGWYLELKDWLQSVSKKASKTVPWAYQKSTTVTFGSKTAWQKVCPQSYRMLLPKLWTWRKKNKQKKQPIVILLGWWKLG